MATLQDFSLVNSYIEKFRKDFNLSAQSKAFTYLCLDLLLNLQEDEIEETFTDGGMDRGIDALHIDDSESIASIGIFNFKHTNKFPRVKRHFPSNEIDKILTIIKQILNKDTNLKKEINPSLHEKIKHIWKLFEYQNPKFTVYLCSNLENNLTKNEGLRFRRELERFNFDLKFFNINNIVDLLTNRDRHRIDGQINIIDTNYFPKIDGNIRALIANVDAEDLLRLVTDNFQREIMEDVFNDNIRIFLKYRSRINRNIKESALANDNYKFFYFNNGLTLTCTKFSYTERRSPVVKLENVQVVNGGQTIHALYDAYCENKDNVKNVNILVRIYETAAGELPQQIAEYTNSQNPVKNRDIRANDYIQKKLEKELSVFGYYYERKKGFYKDKPKNKRLDSEKIGQVLMAFYNEMPGDAKNKKRLIFEDKFEEIFNDAITAKKVLLAYKLYGKVEQNKIKEQSKIKRLKKEKQIENRNFILYASYYLLYLLKKFAVRNDIVITLSNLKEIFKLYPSSIKLLKKLVKEERNKDAVYSHDQFFKGNKLKKQIDDYLDNLTE